jgi:hypothetical protein
MEKVQFFVAAFGYLCLAMSLCRVLFVGCKLLVQHLDRAKRCLFVYDNSELV